MVFTDGVHLVADSLHELHDFARRIHLRPSWFQPGRHAHYDLTTLRATRRAYLAGAQPTTSRHCAHVSRNCDPHYPKSDPTPPSGHRTAPALARIALITSTPIMHTNYQSPSLVDGITDLEPRREGRGFADARVPKGSPPPLRACPSSLPDSEH